LRQVEACRLKASFRSEPAARISTTFIRKQYDGYGRIIREANIKAERGTCPSRTMTSPNGKSPCRHSGFAQKARPGWLPEVTAGFAENNAAVV
jgi:hypothetical protein